MGMNFRCKITMILTKISLSLTTNKTNRRHMQLLQMWIVLQPSFCNNINLMLIALHLLSLPSLAVTKKLEGHVITCNLSVSCDHL